MLNKLKSTINSHPHSIYYVLGAWLILNLLQSVFTELFHDEAYFWVYSTRLDWGYWDHAPMIGLLTGLGTAIFSGKEIGVRLLPVLMNVGTVYIIYLLSEKKNLTLLFAIIFSIAAAHAGGFFAAPDAPLTFFVAVYFYCYKQYLEKDSLRNALLMAVVITLLLYSKYHGLMAVFFTILSYPALLRRKSFWAIAGISLLLYIPHLYWLHTHDYATFQHHIVYRSKKPYNFEPTLNYLYSQLLFYGPLMGLLLFPAAFRYKPIGHFERALTFSVFGVFGFLFLLSFNGHVEANWSAAASLPLFVLGFFFINRRPKWETWTYRLAIPSIVVILFLRLYLMSGVVLPIKFFNQYRGWPEWAQKIESIAGEAPVVFSSTYQLPSKYIFYSGKEAFSLNNYGYHQTQYDLWDIEESLQGRQVLFVHKGAYPKGMEKLYIPPIDTFSYQFINNFRSFNKIDIEALNEDLKFPADTMATLDLRLHNGYDYPVDFSVADYRFYIHLHYRKDGKWGDEIVIKPPLSEVTFQDYYDKQISFPTPKEPGEYVLHMSLVTDWWYGDFGRNGNPIKVIVE